MSTWNMPPGVTTNDLPGQDDASLYEPIPAGEALELRGVIADAMWRAAVVAQERCAPLAERSEA